MTDIEVMCVLACQSLGKLPSSFFGIANDETHAVSLPHWGACQTQERGGGANMFMLLSVAIVAKRLPICIVFVNAEPAVHPTCVRYVWFADYIADAGPPSLISRPAVYKVHSPRP